MDGPANRDRQSSTLFSIVYLGALALVTSAVVCGVWSWLGSGDSSVALASTLETLELRPSPTRVVDRVGIQDRVRRNMTPKQSAELAINNQLRELERFVRGKLSGKTTLNPTWIAPTFAGFGVEPKKFTERLVDRVTRVERYIQTDSAPRFQSKRAFEQFVANVMLPLADCGDVRINLRLETLSLDDGKVQATVLAVAAGARSQAKEEWESSGKEQLAVQSTATWKMNWSELSTDAKKFRLDKIEVSAAENVTLNLNSPRLFVDCSASILAECDCLKNQLVFGLDEWASKLPGVDVQGKQGIAIGDVNGDQLDDIYICQPRGLPNLLLVQNDNATAADKSLDSHTNLLDESRTALFIDIDNDGDQDLAVATDEALLLLSNNGRGEFLIENELSIARRGVSLSAADFDNDGDLDLFLCRHVEQRSGNRLADKIGGSSILLRNDEAFQFSRVEIDTGLPGETPFAASAAVWHDRDLDGDQDLDVASDSLGTLAFENVDGDLSRLKDPTTETKKAIAGSLSVGDFNGDGRSDLFVANRGEGPESFVRYGGQEKDAAPFFLRRPFFSNQFATTSAVLDVNNDGRDDVFVGNGGFTRIARNDNSSVDLGEENLQEAIAARLSIDSRQEHRCFVSIGSGGFAELSSVSGLNFPEDARAAASTDWDHDGDMDLVVLCRSCPQVRIFINALGNQNSVMFHLTGKQSNRDAVGARVEIYLKDQQTPLTRSVQAGNGCRSQSSSVLHFGLGSKKREIESAVVYWPSGLTQTFTGLSPGSAYDVTEGDKSLVARVNSRFNLKFRPAQVVGNFRVPTPAERVMLSPRVSMPALEVQAGESKWASLKLSDQRPTAILLWDKNSESDQALSRLDRLADDLEENNVDLATLFVGSEELRPDETWKYLSTFREDLPNIKNWLSLSDAGREQLTITSKYLFAKSELPQTPILLLLDRQQKLAAVYPADSLKNGILIDDVSLLNRGVPAVASDTLLGGRWAGRNESKNSETLYQQLVDAGYRDAAAAIEPSMVEEQSAQLTQQARDLMSVKRFRFAKQLCDEALKLAPTNPDALLASSDLVLLKTIDKTSEFPVVGSAELGAAREQYEQVLEVKPQEWRAAIGLAKLDLMLGNTDKAKTTLENFLKIDSERAEVQAMMGRVCFQLKEYDQAKRHLGIAHSQRPALPYLTGDLGYLYMVTEEKRTTALKLLRAAHEQQPSDEHFFVLLAQAEFMKGNFAKAVDLYRQITKLVPDENDSKNILAWLLATCPYETKRDGTAALQLLAPKSEDLRDKDPATLEIYAACFAEVGEFDGAIKYQQQAVDKSVQQETSIYSAQQRKGMLTRLEMYRAQKPYRMVDSSQTPLAGNRIAEIEFRALRF